MHDALDCMHDALDCVHDALDCVQVCKWHLAQLSVDGTAWATEHDFSEAQHPFVEVQLARHAEPETAPEPHKPERFESANEREGGVNVSSREGGGDGCGGKRGSGPLPNMVSSLSGLSTSERLSEGEVDDEGGTPHMGDPSSPSARADGLPNMGVVAVPPTLAALAAKDGGDSESNLATSGGGGSVGNAVAASRCRPSK